MFLIYAGACIIKVVAADSSFRQNLATKITWVNNYLSPNRMLSFKNVKTLSVKGPRTGPLRWSNSSNVFLIPRYGITWSGKNRSRIIFRTKHGITSNNCESRTKKVKRGANLQRLTFHSPVKVTWSHFLQLQLLTIYYICGL